MSGTMGYQDKDDARHLYNTPDYYEWWYFDGHFDNGYTCAVGFHTAFAHAKPHTPVINISIFTPEGEDIAIIKPIDPAACSASDEKCDVKMGEYFARQESSDIYHIYGKSKRGGADLIFRRKLPGWKPLGKGHLYDNGTEKQCWLVAMPRAEVEGTLFVGDKSLHVKGLGYHDHNWGNCDLHDSLRSWFWGRLHHPEYTAIYYYLYPSRKGEPDESRFYLAKGDKPILLPDHFNLKYSGEIRDELLKQTMPSDLAITAESDGAKFTMDVHCSAISTRAPITTAAPWYQYYWRLVADCKAEITLDGKVDKITGKPNAEYMLLR
jgi:predicted secreted hydrolase